MVQIRLKIKTIDQDDKMLVTDDEKTIGELRDSIEEITHIEKANQRIIFRGKFLNDDAHKIRDCGLADDMAIHIVKSAPPNTDSAGPAHDHDYGQGPAPMDVDGQQMPGQYFLGHGPQIITQNFIIGRVPLERTVLFQEPGQAMTIVGNVIDQMRGRYQMETEHTMQMDQANNNNFSINIILRGIRQQFVNTPARERFECLKRELRKLAWLVAIVQSRFLRELDEVLSQDAPSPSEFYSYATIAALLRAMHSFDHYEEDQLPQFVINGDAELLSLIDQLKELQLPDDDQHVQQINPLITLRHANSRDLSSLLMMISVVDSKINEHILQRYHRVLTIPHTYQASSYQARLINCFSNAVTRIQHFRAHIYHTLSDLIIHSDQNEHNHLYPQFAAGYQRHDEPPQAQISLMFFDPTRMNMTNATGTQTEQPGNNSPNAPRTQFFMRQQSQSSSNQPNANARPPVPPNIATSNPINSMLSGIMNFAQNLVGGAPPLPPQPRTPATRQNMNHNAAQTDQPTPPPNFMPPQHFLPNVPSPFPWHQQAAAQMSPPNGFPRGWTPPTPPRPQNLPAGPPQPHRRSVSAERVPLTMRQTRRLLPPGMLPPAPGMRLRRNLTWERASPETPNVMFIGPNPPTMQFPLFTMDPFLACPSRRYRTFEMDSRHDDFWNDPTTAAFGIHPPQNSIAALRQGLPIPSIVRNHQGTGQTDGSDGNTANVHEPVQANNNGQAVFTDADQFNRFLRRTFEMVLNCMAQHDSRMLPQSNTAAVGFTATSPVTGYVPYSPPVPPFGFGPMDLQPPSNMPGLAEPSSIEVVLTFEEETQEVHREPDEQQQHEG